MSPGSSCPLPLLAVTAATALVLASVCVVRMRLDFERDVEDQNQSSTEIATYMDPFSDVRTHDALALLSAL